MTTERYTYYGRSYALRAKFEGDDAVEQANAFMEANPGTGLLDYEAGVAYIAALDDMGIPVDQLPAEPAGEPKTWADRVDGQWTDLFGEAA